MEINYSNIIIRKLNENDYENFKILINDFRITYFTKDEFINRLNIINKSSEIWVIEYNKELISCGTIIYEYKLIRNLCKLAHIEDICVLKKYRNKGIGKILIDYLVNIAQNNNCYKITLYCEDNLEKFYSKSGFEKKGIQMAIYF
jgi:N-acetylglutamate synthase-like GNAT family acetyltransferase